MARLQVPLPEELALLAQLIWYMRRKRRGKIHKVPNVDLIGTSGGGELGIPKLTHTGRSKRTNQSHQWGMEVQMGKDTGIVRLGGWLILLLLLLLQPQRQLVFPRVR